MKVAIHTLGTRGDVQPYLTLALALKAKGHQVLMAAPSQFEAFVETRGIPFAHLPDEFLALMETQEAKAAMTGSGGFAGGFKMMKLFKPIGRKQLTAEWAAANHFKPDLIIYHPKAIAVPHIAEQLACPTVLASPLPGFTPTKEFASPLVPFRSLGLLNRLTHRVMAGSAETLFHGMIAEWRETELGLTRKPSRRLRPVATLYAYSPHVVPVPADWPASVAVTGYWFLETDRGWQPDLALKSFLDAGEPPVYVGFGSMPGFNPFELTRLVVEALAASGRRGVLATGGGAISGEITSSHVHIMDGAPHDKLFPMMTACVHHGGAGTTGASLRAGRPTIICPFFGDQPFWAKRIEDLGAGPPPLDPKKMSVDLLARSIYQATSDSAMQRRAAVLGAKVRSEDGIGNAVTFLAQVGLLSDTTLPTPGFARGSRKGSR